MSVINQMLKDLDERKNKIFRSCHQDQAPENLSHPEDQKTSTFLIPLLSCLCLISTGGFGYLLAKQMRAPDVQTSIQELKIEPLQSKNTENLLSNKPLIIAAPATTDKSVIIKSKATVQKTKSAQRDVQASKTQQPKSVTFIMQQNQSPS